MTDLALAAPDRRPRRLHPLALRIMHWINALAMIVMIGSGWEIYNDEVIFGWLHFPHWMTIGGGAGRRAAMAFRRDVDLDAQRALLSRLRARDRPIPAQAAADLAEPR